MVAESGYGGVCAREFPKGGVRRVAKVGKCRETDRWRRTRTRRTEERRYVRYGWGEGDAKGSLRCENVCVFELTRVGVLYCVCYVLCVQSTNIRHY